MRGLGGACTGFIAALIISSPKTEVGIHADL
jgi:hypothetical protein